MHHTLGLNELITIPEVLCSFVPEWDIYYQLHNKFILPVLYQKK